MDKESLVITPEIECSVQLLVDTSYYKEALSLLEGKEMNFTPSMVIAAATCYLNLEQPVHALELLINAEEKGWTLPDIYILKGRALYTCNEYNAALTSFKNAFKIQASPLIQQWIHRCEAHIECREHPNNPHIISFLPQIVETPRFEWYQTQTIVTISFYIQGLSESQVKVDFTENTISISITREARISFYFELPKIILPNESTFNITPSKIEVKLRKASPVKWETCFITK